MSSTKAPYSSKKLIYPATPYLHDFELEFLQTEDELFIYMNFLTAKISSCDDDDAITIVTLQAGKEKKELPAHCLQGGQRLKIPKELIPSFLSMMLHHSEITLMAGNYFKKKISTKTFQQQLSALKKKNLDIFTSHPLTLSL